MKGKKGPTPEDVKPNGHDPELFKEPEPVIRPLRVPRTPEELSELNAYAGLIAIQLDDQHQALRIAKERIKALETDQALLAAKLRDPFKLADVECRWEITLEANAKTLVRMDTGESLETRPLSAEDREYELQRVAAQNQQKIQEAGA